MDGLILSFISRTAKVDRTILFIMSTMAKVDELVLPFMSFSSNITHLPTSPQRWTKLGLEFEPFSVWQRQIRLRQAGNQKSKSVVLVES